MKSFDDFLNEEAEQLNEAKTPRALRNQLIRFRNNVMEKLMDSYNEYEYQVEDKMLYDENDNPIGNPKFPEISTKAGTRFTKKWQEFMHAIEEVERELR